MSINWREKIKELKKFNKVKSTHDNCVDKLMKEKRYFCDLWFDKETDKRVSIGMIIFIIVSIIVCYNVYLAIYRDEINAYPESSYQYLDEITNNVIQQGVGIDLYAFPDNIQTYEITSENNELIFKCYLDHKHEEFVQPAYIIVRLSDDFDIISKERNYSSKDDYEDAVKFQILCYSIFTGLFLVILIILSCSMAALISLKNKNNHKESSD